MDKLFNTLLSPFVIVIFIVCFLATDEDFSKSPSVAREQIPSNIPTVNVEQMFLDLSQNEMRAQKKYSNKWLVIVGTLGRMDSESKYFSLDGEIISAFSVYCDLPSEKRNIIIDKLINMEKGDYIAVKGKVTDMGGNHGL